MAGEDGRPHAALTKTDRQFLASDGDYYIGENANNQRYERRENIRDRIEATIDDLQLLVAHGDGLWRRFDDIPVERWDELLTAVRALHPDPPMPPDPDSLRRIAADLNEKADRVEQMRAHEVCDDAE